MSRQRKAISNACVNLGQFDKGMKGAAIKESIMYLRKQDTETALSILQKANTFIRKIKIAPIGSDVMNKKEFDKVFSKDIEEIKESDIKIKNSISNSIALNKPDIKRYNILFKDKTRKDVVVKHKSNKIVSRGIKLLSCNDFKTRLDLIINHKILGFNKSCEREIFIYSNIDSKLKKYFINFYGYTKKHGDSYMVLDYIENNNKINHKKIIDALIEIHTFYYGKDYIVNTLKLNNYTPNDYKRCKRALMKMFKKLDNNMFSKTRLSNIENFILNIDGYYNKYSYHKTLTHNDFSLRNIFVNNNTLYFYDWELATFQNPEHDLVEFLIYNLKNMADDEILETIDYYRDKLLKNLNIKISQKEYSEIVKFNIYEFLVNKLTLLRLANLKFKYKEINELIVNVDRILDLVGDIDNG